MFLILCDKYCSEPVGLRRQVLSCFKKGEGKVVKELWESIIFQLRVEMRERKKNVCRAVTLLNLLHVIIFDNALSTLQDMPRD